MTAYTLVSESVTLTLEEFFSLPMPLLQAMEVAKIPTAVEAGKVRVGLSVTELANLIARFPRNVDVDRTPIALVAKAGEA